jgi:hypothetical protein
MVCLFRVRFRVRRSGKDRASWSRGSFLGAVSSPRQNSEVSTNSDPSRLMVELSNFGAIPSVVEISALKDKPEYESVRIFFFENVGSKRVSIGLLSQVRKIWLILGCRSYMCSIQPSVSAGSLNKMYPFWCPEEVDRCARCSS